MREHQELPDPPIRDDERKKIFAFFDESINPSGSGLTYVAAAVLEHPEVAERSIVDLFERQSAEPHRWTPDDNGAGNKKFDTFLKEGYHYTTNDLTIQKDFIDLMCRLSYRAHVGYSANPHQLGEVDLLITLFSQLLRSLILRYSEMHVYLIFEQKTEMNLLYAPLVDAVASELARDRNLDLSYTVEIGKKEDPCIAIADYVMGVAAAGMSDGARHYHQVRYADVSRNLAQLFDLDLARNARRGRLEL